MGIKEEKVKLLHRKLLHLLKMTIYIISDLHFNHANIIKYCDRPFSSLEEMNKTMYSYWNSKIEEKDIVYYLGDLAMSPERKALEVAESLNGNILFVDGNHDDISIENAPFPLVKSFTSQIEGIEFYFTHRPEDIPESWDGWKIYGHHHNNFPEDHPFYNPHKKSFHVSAELINYTPLPFSYFPEIIKNHNETKTTVNELPDAPVYTLEQFKN